MTMLEIFVIYNIVGVIAFGLLLFYRYDDPKITELHLLILAVILFPGMLVVGGFAVSLQVAFAWLMKKVFGITHIFGVEL